ncbi:MAG: hypothetical protein LBN32_01025 [Helicobacteraceae bacterium]|nr:hypothetical protein [Helicobacteraceae bacterium]
MHDKTKKNDVRIWYETHDETIKSVADLYEISEKTVAHWVRGESWVRNKYGQDKKRARIILEETAKREIEKGALSGIYDELALTDGAIAPNDYHKQVGGAIIQQIIGLDALHQKMTNAVSIADVFLDNAKDIGTVKTYTEVLKTAKELIYGKEPDTTIKVVQNVGDLSAEAFATMSTAELVRLANTKIENDDESK